MYSNICADSRDRRRLDTGQVVQAINPHTNGPVGTRVLSFISAEHPLTVFTVDHPSQA